MEWALYAIEENEMSIRGTSKKWKIPTATLSKWLGGLATTSKKGSPTVITEEEEHLIVEWCKKMVDVGHGLEIVNLKAKVSQFFQNRPIPFTNGSQGSLGGQVSRTDILNLYCKLLKA